MLGRGRELTLPSWMTNDNVQLSASDVSKIGVVSAPPQPSISASTPALAPTLAVPAIIPNFPGMPIMPTIPTTIPAMPVIPSFGKFTTAPASVSDPNNDVSCWSEFLGEGGRKYWHNRVTGMGTYDKPFCLKTPEERSVPPCAWKEYLAGDKKYYSNGTESTWSMPEEFRVWKEKMDAIELKKQQTPNVKTTSQNFGLGPSVADNNANNKIMLPVVTYATAGDAQDAFRQLLVDKKISSTHKIKDVVDICQFDVRWNALKTQGEKKQFVAEFQTKLLKVEKEEQKNKAKKNRDSFLLMLAEHTDIDTKTRWRDAVAILQDDIRFKNIDDAREREDLFKDFVLELEKKEREDSKKLLSNAINAFTEILEQFHADKKINRLSMWSECRSLLADAVAQPKFKPMIDADFRICFQDFVSNLAENHRKLEKKRKDDYLFALEVMKSKFRQAVEGFVESGLINAQSRWPSVSQLNDILTCSAFTELCRHVDERKDILMPSDHSGVNECRLVFEETIQKLNDLLRSDKRAVKDLLHLMKVKISYDSKFDDLKSLILDYLKSPSGVSSLNIRQTEEGEEIDESPNQVSSSIPSKSGGALEDQLRSIVMSRLSNLLTIFNESKERARLDHEEELRLKQKAERKFLNLLEETFYSSDHVGIVWDDAKKVLQKRSAYDSVGKSDRKRLFNDYMSSLSFKLDAKTKSLKNLLNTDSLSEKYHDVNKEVESSKRDRSHSSDLVESDAKRSKL